MRSYFFSFALAACAASIMAAPLSPEQALERALGAAPKKIAAKTARYELIKTEKTGDVEMLYVFGNAAGDGFIVTPADDCAPAVLGYGDSPLTNGRGEAAPGFEYWISELSRQIAFARSNPSSSKRTIRLENEDKAPIEPLCKTKWSQDEPFNDYCPETSKGKKTVTGCVATAMAQVMKYHNWPPKGEGEVSYKWENETLNANLGNMTFEWDEMLDEYDGTATDAQKLAVAKLMVCAGYSVQMDFDPNGSGAQSIDIAPALGRNFRYDKSLQYLLRDYYTLPEWEDLIYASIKEYGPVIYDGQAGIGGHSFVCDGYQGEGYFHFNWGWGGLSDGYFLLDALDPQHQGIGGANGGFDFMQDVIVGIRPDKTGDSQWAYNVLGQGSLVYRYDESINVIGARATFYNYGPGPVQDAYTGLLYTNLDDPEAEPYFQSEFVHAIQVGRGVNGGVSFDLPELADGRYSVVLAYSSGPDKTQEIPIPIYGKGSAVLTISNGQVTLDSYVMEAPDFEDAVFPQIIDKNSATQVSGKLVNLNNAPYLCYLSEVFIDEGMEEVVAYSAPRPIEMEPDQIVDINLDLDVLGLSNLPDGDYYLAMGEMVMQSGSVTLLCEPQLVTVGNFGAVESLINEQMSGKVEYFTLSGIKVAESQADGAQPRLPKGIYVVRNGSLSHKFVIRK